MKPKPKCWCGNEDLESFSPDYGRCAKCETLVVLSMPEEGHFQVHDDDNDFYGRKYHSSHVTTAFGQSNIFQRSRTDIPERCLYWLRKVLKYRLPRGNALEIGSAHGGFVFLLRQAGFKARGVELSPWLARLSGETFGIETLVGSVEQQHIEPASLDVIAMMDVLEHFPDPLATIRHCATLLKPDGILFMQTPRYPAGSSYEELKNRTDPFLEQLKPLEHMYLFSENSITAFVRELGFDSIVFEKAIFSRYDMFPVVSRAALESVRPEVMERELLRTPAGRLILAMIDLARDVK
jgi:2-polyprenyl-3-methyl-5-hydroxy-6-metoxy-1,4-benzoquinol methylase